MASVLLLIGALQTECAPPGAPKARASPLPEAETNARQAITPGRPVPKPQNARDQKLAAADPVPEPDLADIDVASLLGQDRAVVAELLGTPQSVRGEGMSLIWQYRVSGCALDFVFYPNIKTRRYHALQYTFSDGDGRVLQDSGPCLRRIRDAQRNASQ